MYSTLAHHMGLDGVRMIIQRFKIDFYNFISPY